MSTENLITVDNASVSFYMGRSVMDFIARKEGRVLKAVNQASISLVEGETLGIVGESGCGKSTFGRALIGLQELSGGSIKYRGCDISKFTAEEISEFRQNVQMIFQEPVGALNPRMTIKDAIAEVLSVHNICPKSEIEARTLQLLETVGLPAYLASRKPRGLSGGQCQRVGIARCLAVNPTLIIADEAVSALDVSVQAQVLNLLTELQKKNNLSMVFISHDLTVVRHVCKRVCVMYMGRVVEIGDTKEIFETPRHPYTKALIAAKPKSGGDTMTDVMLLDNEPPSPLNLPSGCAFRTRCPKASEICAKKMPKYANFGDTKVACHLFM